MRRFCDRSGFFGGRVVLPKPRVRRQPIPPGRIECQWTVLVIHGKWRGGRGIHTDADDGIGRNVVLRLRRGEGIPYRRFESDGVIRGILTREVGITGVEEHAMVA